MSNPTTVSMQLTKLQLHWLQIQQMTVCHPGNLLVHITLAGLGNQSHSEIDSHKQLEQQWSDTLLQIDVSLKALNRVIWYIPVLQSQATTKKSCSRWFEYRTQALQIIMPSASRYYPNKSCIHQEKTPTVIAKAMDCTSDATIPDTDSSWSSVYT